MIETVANGTIYIYIYIYISNIEKNHTNQGGGETDSQCNSTVQGTKILTHFK